MGRLKSCPFCGGEAYIQLSDDEGNFHTEDYKLNPYSGITYTIRHYESDNKKCPIASHDRESIGSFLYDSEEELVNAWNNRNNDFSPCDECKYLQLIVGCEINADIDSNYCRKRRTLKEVKDNG